MRKKVLAIFPSIHLYGKERSNIEVFRILASYDNISLTIIANKFLSKNLLLNLKGFNVKFCKYPSRENKRYRYIRYLYRFLLTNIYFTFLLFRIRPDIIFLNNEMSIYDLFPVLYLTKSKLIYRIGDIPAFPSISAYKINSKLWQSIAVKKTDTIISISKFIKGEVEKTGRKSNNDKVIYNYPPSRNQSEMAKQRTINKVLTIGYLGQIRELKGVHILIDATISFLEQGYDINLILAGDVNLFPEYSNKLLSKIKKKSLDQKISFIGEINDISTFFNKIDILCVPTIWPEALGNVLVEAKQYYTPLIIFPSGGMPELVRHEEDGYICKDISKESLIEAFFYYYNNHNEIIRQGINSYTSLRRLGIIKDAFVESWKNVFGI
ncbi:MAG: glycosyltransferase family 4 protein [Muribaculum sp.]|nr:glycosyltransferase family 4 protein [Muribaculum sp.]